MSEKVKTLRNLDENTVEQLNFLADGVMDGQQSLGELLMFLQNISLAQERGLTGLAESTGLGRESLYKILSYTGSPRLNTFIEIIRALGLKIKFEKYSYESSMIPGSPLAQNNEKLLEEWDYARNNHLSPEMIMSGSHITASWVCSKNKDHSWISSIAKRSNGGNCPYCLGQKVASSNSLLASHPEIARSWDYEKNIDLKPSDVMANSNKRIWWQCDENHEWSASVRSRVVGFGCPSCA